MVFTLAQSTFSLEYLFVITITTAFKDAPVI